MNTSSPMVSYLSSPTHWPRSEEELFRIISRHDAYYKDRIKRLLNDGNEKNLILWLQSIKLLPISKECSECYGMSRLVSGRKDKFFWRCTICGFPVKLRKNTVFEGLSCTIPDFFKIVCVWSVLLQNKQDLAESFARVHPRTIKSICNIMENAISARPITSMGGFGFIMHCELYPDFVSQYSEFDHFNEFEEGMNEPKILCLAEESTFSQTRYWLHPIHRNILDESTENFGPRTLNFNEEIQKVITLKTYPGSQFIKGKSERLATIYESLEAQPLNANSISLLNNNTTDEMVFNIWRPIINVCQQAQRLPPRQIAKFLNWQVWSKETDISARFSSALTLLSRTNQQ